MKMSLEDQRKRQKRTPVLWVVAMMVLALVVLLLTRGLSL